MPRPQLGELEAAIGRHRFRVIAIAVVVIVSFAVLGAMVGRLNGRIGELATTVNGIDASFGAKFEETNARLDPTNTKLDTISGRFAAEVKSLGAEIKAMEAQMATQTNAIAKSIAAVRAGRLPPPTSLQPSPAPVQPSSTPTPNPATTPPQPLSDNITRRTAATASCSTSTTGCRSHAPSNPPIWLQTKVAAINIHCTPRR